MKVTNSKVNRRRAPSAGRLKRGQALAHSTHNSSGDSGSVSSHRNAKSPLTTASKSAPPATADSTSRADNDGEIAAASVTGNELSGLPQKPLPSFSAFGSLRQFEEAKQMAALLAHSTMVPENFRGEEHLGDCVIALEIANRVGASVLAVMQNLYLVQGKPAWSSQFLISCVNSTKRFSPLRYEMTGTSGEDSYGCIAWATDQAGALLKSPEVTIKMAKEEGWYERLGSRWKTMPELMLRYRSAALFTRLYAPEITMGIQTTEEIAEMGYPGNGKATRPVFETSKAKPKPPRSQREPSESGLVDLFPSADSQAEPSGDALAPRTVQELPCASSPTAVLLAPKAQYNYLKALSAYIGLSQHSEAQVLSFLCNTGKCDLNLASLAEVMNRQPDAIAWAHEHWQLVDQELTLLKKGNGL